MSLEISLPDKTQAEIAADLARFRSQDTARRLNAAVGKRVEIEHRRYFAARPRNKKGWPSQGFWRRRIRNATALTSYDAQGSVVTIADPAMNQKVYGGTIRPREGKFLTIPARKEANGRSPRTFNDLRFVPIPGRGKLVGLLVRARQTFVGNRRTVGGEVFYYCVTEVNQAPDPDALPRPIAIETAINDEVGKFFTREWKRRGVR